MQYPHNTTRGRQLDGRKSLQQWQQNIAQPLHLDPYVSELLLGLRQNINGDDTLVRLSQQVPAILEPLIAENHRPQNLPVIDHYDGIGNTAQQVKHHPVYEDCGDIIYGSGLMQDLADGEMLRALLKFYFTAHGGEAGHNCPVACSAGVLRVLQKTQVDAPEQLKKFWIEKLCAPSYRDNFTGAQFVTEVQGGSDVGQNDCVAEKDKQGHWRIRGEKWFCSNANAELILMTARVDNGGEGTAGLSLFLVPAKLKDGSSNGYVIRRLKDKLGTRSMASAEIDFVDALAYAVGDPMQPKQGFKLLMQNVLHLSRLFNSIAATGATHRAWQIAAAYAEHRIAFGQAIGHYPLVQKNLLSILSENLALTLSSLATIKAQQQFDQDQQANDSQALLLRTRANLNKYMTAKYSVQHIHHSIDVLAGNGAIESFSALPRLLRDAIVYENWEGTHNTLFMQMLRDMHRYNIDQLMLKDLQLGMDNLKANKETRELLQAQWAALKNMAESLRAKDFQTQPLLIAEWVTKLGWFDAYLHLYAIQNEANEKLIAPLLHWLAHQYFDGSLSSEAQVTLLADWWNAYLSAC